VFPGAAGSLDYPLTAIVFPMRLEAIVSEDAVPGNTHPMALATAAHTYSMFAVVNPARLILPPPTT